MAGLVYEQVLDGVPDGEGRGLAAQRVEGQDIAAGLRSAVGKQPVGGAEDVDGAGQDVGGPDTSPGHCPRAGPALATEGDIAPPRVRKRPLLPTLPPRLRSGRSPSPPGPAVPCRGLRFVLVWAGRALPWNDIHSCGGTALRPRWGAAPTWIPFVLLNAVLMAVAAWI